MIDVVYGMELQKQNDPYVTLVEISTDGLIEATIPGHFLVDLAPALKYIPSWLPGAGFKRKAALWSETNVKLLENPWNEAKAKLVRVMHIGSIPAANGFAHVRGIIL